MSNNKQSSIEWLEKEINKRGPMENNPPQWLKNLYKQAKAMHENEIIEAWENGNHKEMRGGKYLKPLSSKYYNETFNSDEA